MAILKEKKKKKNLTFILRSYIRDTLIWLYKKIILGKYPGIFIIEMALTVYIKVSDHDLNTLSALNLPLSVILAML